MAAILAYGGMVVVIVATVSMATTKPGSSSSCLAHDGDNIMSNGLAGNVAVAAEPCFIEAVVATFLPDTLCAAVAFLLLPSGITAIAGKF
ncbi:hypothetical protein CTI12_AA017260 [Artemisia annua]|uniref:Uncharacterized protein n=1 Tax=Artemisia annua TaxID=35608 RepID=A0A2U1QKN7_ARTAN|nr:hypothetical protein CTI12_AA017260 [Artemisia annua]